MHLFFRYRFAVICLLAGGMVLSGTACKKSGMEALPAPGTPSARLMILQPNPYLPTSIDMYSVYMDTARINAEPVAWPGLMQYITAPSGNRWISAMAGGTFTRYYTYPFYFKPGSSYTIYSVDMIKTSYSNYAFVEDDLSDPVPGNAKIRVIQGCPNGNFQGIEVPVDWMIHNGDTLAKKIGYRSIYDPTNDRYRADTTSFRQLKAGDYWFDIKNSNAPYDFRATLQAALKPGGIYTILAAGVMQQDRSLKMGLTLIQNK